MKGFRFSHKKRSIRKTDTSSEYSANDSSELQRVPRHVPKDDDIIPKEIADIHNFYPDVSLVTLLDAYSMVDEDIEKLMEILEDGPSNKGGDNAYTSNTEDVLSMIDLNELPKNLQQEAEKRLHFMLEVLATMDTEESQKFFNRVSLADINGYILSSGPPSPSMIDIKNLYIQKHNTSDSQHYYKLDKDENSCNLYLGDELVTSLCDIVSKFPNANPMLVIKKLISNGANNKSAVEKAQLWENFPDLSPNTIEQLTNEDENYTNQRLTCDEIGHEKCLKIDDDQRSDEGSINNKGSWAMVKKFERCKNFRRGTSDGFYSDMALNCYDESLRIFKRALRERKRGGLTGKGGYEYFLNKSREMAYICDVYRKVQETTAFKSLPALRENFTIDLHNLSVENALLCVDRAITTRESFPKDDERHKRAICVITGSGSNKKTRGKIAPAVRRHLLNSEYKLYIPPDNVGCIYILDKKKYNT